MPNGPRSGLSLSASSISNYGTSWLKAHLCCQVKAHRVSLHRRLVALECTFNFTAEICNWRLTQQLAGDDGGDNDNEGRYAFAVFCNLHTPGPSGIRKSLCGARFQTELFRECLAVLNPSSGPSSHVAYLHVTRQPARWSLHSDSGCLGVYQQN
jgi:hypothetical protein